MTSTAREQIARLLQRIGAGSFASPYDLLLQGEATGAVTPAPAVVDGLALL